MKNFPLTPEEFIKLEYKTLELIKSNGSLMQLGDHKLLDDIGSSLAYMKNIINKKLFKKECYLLKFESYLLTEINDEKYKIYFGGHITIGLKKNYDVLTYYFTLYNIKLKKIVRKFHFDFDNRDARDFKPYYHLQYAGRLSKYMIDDGVPEAEKENIYGDQDQPRLPYMPMTLIQMISIILKSFCYPDCEEIINSKEWIGQLRKCEKQTCLKFHSTCTRHLRDDKSLLLNCFGMN